MKGALADNLVEFLTSRSRAPAFLRSKESAIEIGRDVFFGSTTLASPSTSYKHSRIRIQQA